jgi:hypothetical protein
MWVAGQDFGAQEAGLQPAVVLPLLRVPVGNATPIRSGGVSIMKTKTKQFLIDGNDIRQLEQHIATVEGFLNRAADFDCTWVLIDDIELSNGKTVTGILVSVPQPAGSPIIGFQDMRFCDLGDIAGFDSDDVDRVVKALTKSDPDANPRKLSCLDFLRQRLAHNKRMMDLIKQMQGF